MNFADLQQKYDDLLHEFNSVIQQKNKETEFLKKHIKILEDHIKNAHRKNFAASSEKLSPDQLGLFNEAEETEFTEEKDTQENASEENNSITVDAHQRRKKTQPRIPDDLPREDIMYDLPENEKVCPNDGTSLKLIGNEIHEQLDIIPAQVKVLRHTRLKYACPCCEQHIATAKKPKQPIEKSIASPSVLAYVATQKYCDALPLFLQKKSTDKAKYLNVQEYTFIAVIYLIG